MAKIQDMKKFAFYSDLLFTFCLSGSFTLVFFRFLDVALFPALFLATVCGVLSAASVGAILLVKRKNLSLKKSDEERKRKLLLHLALLSDEEKTRLFSELLTSDEEPVSRFGRLRIFNKTEFYFLQFRPNPLSADEIPAFARLKTGKRKILLCAQIEDAALELCRRLDIEVRTGEWTYSLFQERNALPEKFLGDDGGLPRQKHRVKAWFSKKNAKRFLLSGGLILLLARLTPFYLYYLLLGCALLLVAAVVRIFGYA